MKEINNGTDCKPDNEIFHLASFVQVLLQQKTSYRL